jgi:hypothetical protein
VGFSFLPGIHPKAIGILKSIQEDKVMADQRNEASKKSRGLTVDGWAVAIALLLAALVRLGVLKHVAW